jgi:hypothetical protein
VIFSARAFSFLESFSCYKNQTLDERSKMINMKTTNNESKTLDVWDGAARSQEVLEVPGTGIVFPQDHVGCRVVHLLDRRLWWGRRSNGVGAFAFF